MALGWVTMSTRELNQIEVLSQIADRRITVEVGADLMALSERQVYRLLSRFREDGAPAIRHKARGRPPNNRIHAAKRDYALALVRENYADFGPTLAAEMLAERHDFTVSRETLRTWMSEAGIWLSRRQRRTFHQPRRRRECLGELVQIDGSDHRWLEDRGDPCTLLVFIDDATSTFLALRFVPSESTFSYFEALEGYLQTHGRPVAFYSDKHSIFRVAKQDAEAGAGVTQFGRALSDLNIEILCANSSEAKGRVERANRTLQDRLVKELRLEGINDIEAANAFLPSFMQRFNGKFAKAPARSDNLHRALNVEPERLSTILCWREKRYVGKQLTFSYERKRIILEENDTTRGLVGKHVDTFAFPDGQFQVRWRGMLLPYSVFDKDQRVHHAAVTENKRLSAVLAQVMQQQEAEPPKPAVRTNSERMGYQSNGRPRGRPSGAHKRTEQSAEQSGPHGLPGLR